MSNPGEGRIGGRRGALRSALAAGVAAAVCGTVPGPWDGVAGPVPLAAQEEPAERIDSPYRWIERGLRMGPWAGWLNADRGNLEFGPGSTLVLGGRFRARVSSPLSLELDAGYGAADRYVIDPRPLTGPVVADTVSSGWVMGAAAIQFALTGARTWNGIQPYAVFGGGLLIGVDEGRSEVFADSALADLRYEIGTAPLFQVGVGIEVFPSDRLGIGLELRDYLIRLKAPDGYFDDDVLDAIEESRGEAPTESQWPHNLELSLTFWYYP